jgi:hypothetical protein
VYQPRLIDGLLEHIIADFPAIVITGPSAKNREAVRST